MVNGLVNVLTVLHRRDFMYKNNIKWKILYYKCAVIIRTIMTIIHSDLSIFSAKNDEITTTTMTTTTTTTTNNFDKHITTTTVSYDLQFAPEQRKPLM